LDALFEEKADTQYTRELTFSSVVDLMGQVVTSAFPSVRAAFLNKSFGISVSLTSLYNKLQGIEAEVAAQLVRHTAGQFQPLIQEIGGALPEPVPGYQMHVLDGCSRSDPYDQATFSWVAVAAACLTRGVGNC
jgi:hypothetical protein